MFKKSHVKLKVDEKHEIKQINTAPLNTKTDLNISKDKTQASLNPKSNNTSSLFNNSSFAPKKTESNPNPEVVTKPSTGGLFSNNVAKKDDDKPSTPTLDFGK